MHGYCDGQLIILELQAVETVLHMTVHSSLEAQLTMESGHEVPLHMIVSAYVDSEYRLNRIKTKNEAMAH